jgi:hypothetical protein
MTHQSLEEALQDAERPVEMLRNSRMGPHAFSVTAEFTNRGMSSVPGERPASSSSKGVGPVPTMVGMGAIYLAVTLGMFLNPAPKQRDAGRRL